MINKSKWNNIKNGWEEIPLNLRKQIILFYYKHGYKKGKTFNIGKRLIKEFPILIVVKGVSYSWETFKYVPESYETIKKENNLVLNR